MGLFLGWCHKLLCMHVYKDLIQCKSVCDIKPGIDPCPILKSQPVQCVFHCYVTTQTSHVHHSIFVKYFMHGFKLYLHSRCLLKNSCLEVQLGYMYIWLNLDQSWGLNLPVNMATLLMLSLLHSLFQLFCWLGCGMENSAQSNKKCAARESKRMPVGKFNKRSFWVYQDLVYTLWLVNFDRFCQHSIITDGDEICDMAEVSDLSTNVVVFKSVMNNTLKDFLFAILPTGFELFHFFPRVMSGINVKGGDVFLILWFV